MLITFFPKQIGNVSKARIWAKVRAETHAAREGTHCATNDGKIERPSDVVSHFIRYRAKKKSSLPAQKRNRLTCSRVRQVLGIREHDTDGVIIVKIKDTADITLNRLVTF